MKRVSYIVMACILALCWFACDRTTDSDNTPPTVKIIHPLNNTIIYKGLVDTIRVQATDNKEVLSVQIYINDQLVCIDEEEPYEYEWDTENSKNTECTIYAKAVDANGNYAFSDPINVYLTVTGTVTDIDGNVYNTIKIGTQWWMTENLKVTHYQNGDLIPEVNDLNVWDTLQSGASCIYNGDPANEEIYGRLYNFYAVEDERGLPPEGWHIPSRGDWEVLCEFLGGGDIAGGKMKTTGTLEAGTGLWLEPNYGATNESGFSAQPGGGLYAGCIGFGAYFWSTFIDDYGDNVGYELLHNRYRCREDIFDMEAGLSVRCVMGNQINYPPVPPYDPYPENLSDSIYIFVTLDWRSEDVDYDQIFYDVYVGIDENPPLLYSDLETSEIHVDSLDYNMTYYWKVVARDSYGNETEGDVWQFTTEPIYIDIIIPNAQSSYEPGERLWIVGRTNLIDETV
ncbi:MAG: hypothetical protein JW794_06960, partial [Candidatus Cloacimonetes bacterium]|nr:hypothetical protein [Candidatus Cloacimonadota bacterium]